MLVVYRQCVFIVGALFHSAHARDFYVDHVMLYKLNLVPGVVLERIVTRAMSGASAFGEWTVIDRKEAMEEVEAITDICLLSKKEKAPSGYTVVSSGELGGLTK